MDYRYLKAFLLTAEFSSFSKAAESLKIAQSAVSRQIKLLEESLDQELIIRSSKKVLLTNKGKELYLAAKQFDEMSDNIFQKEDDRPLRIGILNGLLKNWFMPYLTKYCKKYQRQISIHIEDQPQLRAGIEEGKFDITFSTDNLQSELVSSLKLFSEKLVLISKSEVDLKKLHDYRWIVFSDGDNLFKLSKKQAKSVITVDSIHTILTLVRNNLGLAVVPYHVLKKNESLCIYELPKLPNSEIFMTTLSYKQLPQHIKELTNLIQAS
ncbi:LysR family transcriptional regulator [Halobacteriovorax sp. HLS]|uniref:LysR family transcriptional regulator n=1 Tax=Halobacteriovorax sp. HLS TaxID=2234000 RepID=UPI000FDB8582|nr:LysR family transcriptional regulator [Halobacteriovorax sp. HLS]